MTTADDPNCVRETEKKGATPPPAFTASLLDGNSVPGCEARISVCVVCCSTASLPHTTIQAVARSFDQVASVRSVILSEGAEATPEGVEAEVVPCGTKLSKIRRFASLVSADLLCICDPDLTVDEEACRAVLDRAAAEARDGNEVLAFGLVEGKDDGTLLSQVIAMDKWLSHCIIRLVPLAASITHQLVELLGKSVVDAQREQTRERQQALMKQHLSAPLAEWLTQWPATGGSDFERLQLALRRIPTAIAQLESRVQMAMQDRATPA